MSEDFGMVMTPPKMRNKLLKIRIELEFLKLKEKCFGHLSESELARKKELIRHLSVKY